MLPLALALGLFIFCAGAQQWGPQRVSRACFWMLLGVLIAAADWLPDAALGAGVLAVAVLGVVARTAPLAEDEALSAERAFVHGPRLLWPALALPVLTLLVTLSLRALVGRGLIPIKMEQAALYGVVIATVFALGIAWALLARNPARAVRQGGDLLDSIGWPMVLPLLLAVLGAVYAKAGVGEALAAQMDGVFPVDNRYACVAAYGLGMAAFTMLIGNAFAAFPVMTAAIGIPLIVVRHHGDPAAMAAIGMLCGYCGTLLTPLAATFNLVPVALLGLDSPYAVIRAQIWTALPLLSGNLVLMGWLVFL